MNLKQNMPIGLKVYQNKLEAKQYAKQYQSIDMPHVIDLLIKVMPKNKTIISLGCGSGRDENALMEKGYNVIATDGSQAMLDEVKKYHPTLPTKLVRLPDFPVPEKKVGGIFSIAMLMHLSTEDINKSLQKMYDSIEEDGHLIYSVSLNRNDINEEGFDEAGRYFNQLAQEDWNKMATDAGFSLVEESIFGDSLGRTGVAWLTSTFKK